MYKSPSHLPDVARAAISHTLVDRLSDGLELHTQLKLAHWNVRGPQFPALHPLFEQFAIQLAAHNDAIAERAVTLGGRAQVARHTRLAEFPADASRDSELVAVIADRFDVYLAGARTTRAIAEQHGDVDTADLLTTVIGDFEKNAWFLRATLA
jgi:starvation-inducible DNA-binding protein